MFDLSIENFKCFRKESISFSDLTIFAGANASGKSSVIQTLLLIRNFFIVNGSILKGVVSKEKGSYPVNLNRHAGLNLGNSSQILHHDFSDEVIRFFISDKETQKLKLEFPVQDIKGDGGSVAINISENSFIDEAFMTSNSLAKKDTFYYLNAERMGPRFHQNLTENFQVGYCGEFIAQAIAAQSSNKTHLKKCCPFNSSPDTSFQKQMNLWSNYLVPTTAVGAAIYKSHNLAAITFKNNKYPQYNISPPNTGFGMSYFLPIIACCLLAPENAMVVIESPEAHLSPSVQSKMGIFLGYMANAGLKIVIETHSDHVVNGIRLAVKQKMISNEKVLFNYFSLCDDSIYPSVEAITVNKDSSLSSWPTGFFDQMEQDLININRP